MKDLREELQKVREAAQLAKEAAEAEKQAAYMPGVEETQVRLTKELSIVCREYCGISWGKALDAVGVPVDSDLRRPENVYYDPEICELLGPLSFHPEQVTQASKQPLVDQPLLLPWKFLRNLTKMVAKVRKPRISRAWVKIKTRRKLLLILRRKPQMLLPLNPVKL